MLRSRFFVDEFQNCRAEFQQPYAVIGWFLEQDVQASLESCSHIRSICRDVLEGRLEGFQSSGNAHVLIIEANTVTLQNQFAFDNASCVITLNDLIEALDQWRALIEIGRR